MTDDAQLIADFAESRSQDAFARLVGRHVHLVYSSCLRQLHHPVLADQATAAVFVLLARQAGKVKGAASLVPWVFDATRRICAGAGKMAAKAEAGGMPAAHGIYSGPTDWGKISPLIDEAIEAIPDGAREAVLLKYVANLPLRDVADAMGVDDRGAGQRISAGVARLRRYFEARNIFLPPDALVAAMQAHMVQGAPNSVAYNAAMAALSPANPSSPAMAIADAAATSMQRERWISLTSALVLALLVGFCAVKLYRIVRHVQIAATQAATAPVQGSEGGAPGGDVNHGGPSLPPLPDKPVAEAKPIRPLDPQLAARFIQAVRQSELSVVQQLIEDEPGVVNAKDMKSGRSAVEIAADLVDWSRQDATQIAHLLIEQGAQTSIFTGARAGHRNFVIVMLHLHPELLDAKDAEGLSALQRAALLKGTSPECEAVADLLIQAGAKVDLWTACTLGRLDDVQQALAENPKLVNEPCLGATALNWATRPRRYASDPLAIPKLLIEKGADIRSHDSASDGMTPLHHAAAWGGQAAVAGLLLEKGVDVNILDDFGWTPLDDAIDRGRKEMIEFLESKGGKRTTKDYPDQPVKTARFYAAVRAGDVDLTHRLIDDTPELAKARGATGETPLHWAAAEGSREIIDLLLAEKVDVNAQETNKFGGTPLHWAVKNDRLETVKYLIGKGADVKALNARSGQTVLHVAAENTDDVALVELLLGKGIDPAAKDRFGKRAMDYARERGHAKVAGKLGG